MSRPKGDNNLDDRFQMRLPSKLKINAEIRALQLGYNRSNGGLSAYIIDLLKKDGVKDE